MSARKWEQAVWLVRSEISLVRRVACTPVHWAVCARARMTTKLYAWPPYDFHSQREQWESFIDVNMGTKHDLSWALWNPVRGWVIDPAVLEVCRIVPSLEYPPVDDTNAVYHNGFCMGYIGNVVRFKKFQEGQELRFVCYRTEGEKGALDGTWADHLSNFPDAATFIELLSKFDISVSEGLDAEDVTQKLRQLATEEDSPIPMLNLTFFNFSYAPWRCVTKEVENELANVYRLAPYQYRSAAKGEDSI